MSTLHCVSKDGSCWQIPPAGDPVPGFREYGTYRLRVESAIPCLLLIDEVVMTPLPALNEWEWSPGFYAGTVEAELRTSEGDLIAQYLLDVSPDPAKLGQHDFIAMVKELFEFAPHLALGTEAAQLEIGHAGDFEDPDLAYARIRYYRSILITALKALVKRPLHHLATDRESLPAHRVRKLDRQSLTTMLRNPTVLTACRTGELDAPQLQFDVPRSREVLDTPAHRTLLHVIHAVIRRGRQVAEKLEESAQKEEPSHTRTARSPRLPVRLKLLAELDHELRKIVEREPFTCVTRREISAAGLNTISAHPLYSRVFRTCWNILRPGIAGERSEESVWMSPTWEIYERWCFVKIREALKSAYPGLEWCEKNPSSRMNCWLVEGKADGTEVRLHLQPYFASYDNAATREGFYSVSAERYPDIVLTLTSADTRRFLVFDAKYRTSRANVLDAMQSAHLYHDGLRWGEIAPDLALLCVPAGGGAAWLENPEFWIKHRVGVLPVSPESTRQLAQRIKEVLNR